MCGSNTLRRVKLFIEIKLISNLQTLMSSELLQTNTSRNTIYAGHIHSFPGTCRIFFPLLTSTEVDQGAGSALISLPTDY